MEKNNQVASSFTNDLFGARDSSPNSAANGIFSSIFAAPTVAAARNYSTSKLNGNEHKLPHESQSLDNGVQGDVIEGKEDESNFISSKEMNTILQEKPGPSPLSSSLYYGAKEDMYVISSSPRASGPDSDYKKGAVDDASGNNSTDACRGNWWQGSLYY